MRPSRSHSLSTTLIRAAAAGAGTALAGPLVGALAGLVGHLLSGTAVEAVQSHAEKFGDKAGEKLLELGGDKLANQLGKSPSNLESIYRETLRRSLKQIHAGVNLEFDDWFVNWEACLAAPVPLELSAIRSEQLLPANLDGFFRGTMESLDAQGAAVRRGSTSLKLVCRSVPAPLVERLQGRLPALLEENFRDVISEAEYGPGWVQLQWEAHRDHKRSLREMHRKTDALPAEIVRELAKYLEERKLLQSLPAAPPSGEPSEPWELRNFVTGPWATASPAEPLLRAGQWVVARFQSKKPSETWKDPYARLEGLWDGPTRTASRFAQEPFRGILRNQRETPLRPTALCIPSYKADVEWREETLVRGPLWHSVKLAVVQRFLKQCSGKRMICLILHIGLRDDQGICSLYSEDYDRFLWSEWPYYKGLEAALSTNDLYKKTWSELALQAVIEKRLMQNEFVREAMPARYRHQIEHRPILRDDVELVLRGLIENYHRSTAARDTEGSLK